MLQLLVRAQDRGQRRHLGLPVEVPEPHVRQPLAAARAAPRPASARRRSSPCAAMDRSVVSKSGWRSSEIHTVGGQNSLVARSRSIVRSSSVRVRAGQDDARRAEVDVDGEEAVQLGAVVHRQRVHLDVVGRHPAVDDAADVLRDQRAAGEHARPWAATRCREVYISRSGSSSATITSGGAVVRVLRPVVDVLPAASAPAVPTGRSSRGRRRPCRPRERLLGGGCERVLGDDPGGAGVLEDVGDLVGAEHEVDRHQHDAEPGGGERRARRTASSCATAARAGRPCASAAGGERVRGPVHRGVELGEGQPDLSCDDGELRRSS